MLRPDRVEEVRPVEAAAEVGRALQAELFDDVGLHPRGRGRGEGRQRRAGEAGPQLLQLAVLGPEVVAPLGDAVRLVDREEGELDALEKLQEAGQDQPLGRDVEQLDLAARRSRAARNVAGTPSACSRSTWTF